MRKILSLLFIATLLCGCSFNNDSKSIRKIEDLDGKTCGVLNGSFHGQFIKDNYKDIDVSIVYQNTNSELLMSLMSNRIDAVAIDTPFANQMVSENDGISSREIENSEIASGFIFSDANGELLKDFNDFITRAKESGLIGEIENKWINADVATTKVIKKEYTPTKGTINAIISNASPPFSFVADNELQGFCVEVLYEFGYDKGYDFNFSYANFDGILSGVSTGKYDIGVDEVTITEERKKNVTFSEPIHSTSISLVYLDDSKNVYTSPYELSGKKMGCMSGSIYDRVIEDKLNNHDIDYFNSRSELIMGLQKKKIEGYLADKPVAMICCAENKSITYIDEALDYVDYGVCFSSNASHIREEFNEYLNTITANGTIEQLREKWFKEDSVNETIDDIVLTGENGVIRACSTPDAAPFSFIRNNSYEGYEVELLTMFSKEYGYKLEIDSVSFDAIISAIASNKYDVAFNGIYITEERKKSVDFSDSTYSSSVVAVVRSGDEEKTSFIDGLTDKFYRTFIEEDRYKIILNGVKTTLIITSSSLFFGTLFGFIIFFLSRKLGKWFAELSDAIAYIIDGLPVVVLLMVLFYIVFAQAPISGEVISIIGFSLIACYSVYGLLKTGVDAIDKGQFEGALALGYTDNQTLFKFILPQALRIVMPSYRSSIVSLIKSSSIVGYVTVEDLTRASDLIRSRTYDAFFPLIVTAIIYFVLAWLLTVIVNKMQIKFLPNEKSKEEILKSLIK